MWSTSVANSDDLWRLAIRVSWQEPMALANWLEIDKRSQQVSQLSTATALNPYPHLGIGQVVLCTVMCKYSKSYSIYMYSTERDYLRTTQRNTTATTTAITTTTRPAPWGVTATSTSPFETLRVLVTGRCQAAVRVGPRSFDPCLVKPIGPGFASAASVFRHPIDFHHQPPPTLEQKAEMPDRAFPSPNFGQTATILPPLFRIVLESRISQPPSRK